MAKKKSEYPRTKFTNCKNGVVKDMVTRPNHHVEQESVKSRDLLFKETIATLKANKDFFKKLTDEADEQMSRSIFKVNPK